MKSAGKVVTIIVEQDRLMTAYAKSISLIFLSKEKETVEEVVEEAAAPLTKEEALDKAIAEAEAK